MPSLTNEQYAPTSSYSETSLTPRHKEGTASSLLVIPTRSANFTTFSGPTFCIICAVIEFIDRAIASRKVIISPDPYLPSEFGGFQVVPDTLKLGEISGNFMHGLY